MFRKIVFLLMTATVPLMFMTVVAQANRYVSLKEEVRAMEREQREWIDSNRRLLLGIAVLESPSRVDAIARGDLKLERVSPENVMKVVVGGGQ